jgi:hypothetical protein
LFAAELPKRVVVLLAVSPRLNMLFDGGGPAGVKEAVLPNANPVLFAVGVAAADPAGVAEAPNKLGVWA